MKKYAEKRERREREIGSRELREKGKNEENGERRGERKK